VISSEIAVQIISNIPLDFSESKKALNVLDNFRLTMLIYFFLLDADDFEVSAFFAVRASRLHHRCGLENACNYGCFVELGFCHLPHGFGENGAVLRSAHPTHYDGGSEGNIYARLIDHILLKGAS
jgi:hypothetical protein